MPPDWPFIAVLVLFDATANLDYGLLGWVWKNGAKPNRYPTRIRKHEPYHREHQACRSLEINRKAFMVAVQRLWPIGRCVKFPDTPHNRLDRNEPPSATAIQRVMRRKHPAHPA